MRFRRGQRPTPLASLIDSTLTGIANCAAQIIGPNSSLIKAATYLVLFGIVKELADIVAMQDASLGYTRSASYRAHRRVANLQEQHRERPC